MATYIVTGGTGFLGRAALPLLLERDQTAQIHVLVRAGSVAKLEEQVSAIPGGDRVHPLIGDLTEPGWASILPPPADHVLHLGAIYDITAGDEQASTNVEGTRSVVELAAKLGATLHHVSSVAVAGDYPGTFSETDFDCGQGFPTPYHRTKFEAEKLVREREGLTWRVYRPSAVVGNSVTGGEMDKIDGPYYLFPGLALLAKLPAALPRPDPQPRRNQYGARRLRSRRPRRIDARARPRRRSIPSRESETSTGTRNLCRTRQAAGAPPRPALSLPGVIAKPFVSPLPMDSAESARKVFLDRIGMPAALLDNMTMAPTFTSERTVAALAGSGLAVPRVRVVLHCVVEVLARKPRSQSRTT